MRPYNVLDRTAGDSLADGRVTKILVLREHRHGRMAQREFVPSYRLLYRGVQAGLLAVQRAQAGDINRQAGNSLDLTGLAAERLDVQGE